MPTLCEIPNELDAINIKQIAYPIGKEKDSYYLVSYFTLDVETGLIYSFNKAYLNYYGIKELLLEGTALECSKVIKELVDARGGIPTQEELYPELMRD